MIFVFGSNLAGRHGAGAAKHAVNMYNAAYGVPEGVQGRAYAIPTKDASLRTLPLKEIAKYVERFIQFAEGTEEVFRVTRIGCGLAGYSDKDIAPMFLNAPLNCHFDEAWKPFLGDSFEYWGHVA